MPINYQHWVIKNQPANGVVLDQSSDKATFELKQNETIDPSTLQDDEILVKSLYISNDPAQLFWIYSPFGGDYGARLPVGSDITARGIGKVVESKSSKYQKDDIVYTVINWSEYAKVNVKTQLNFPINTSQFPVDKIPLDYQLSVFGITSITAWLGYFKVANIDPAKDTGKTFLVTGAAGAVGSVAVQIASKVLKAKKVYAIAGGEEKIKYVESIGDNVVGIDYKDKNFKENFKKAVGEEKINYFFDNVGGDILEYSLQFLGIHAVVIICGAISTYKDTKPKPFYGLPLIVSKRLKLEGFVVGDYASEFAEIREQLLQWYNEGHLPSLSTVVDARGDKFDKVPAAWDGLFHGSNKGKLITQVGDA